MADWKFTDDYSSQYPALAGSVLGLLVFSDHTITGTAFTGTLDFAATPALATFRQLAGVSALAMTGTVTSANNTLRVDLHCDTNISGGLTNLPLIGSAITGSAVTIKVVTRTTDDPDDPDYEPGINEFDLSVTFKVGHGEITVTAQVPLCEGFTSLTGTTKGLGIDLQHLDFLVNPGGDRPGWYPSDQLQPLASKSPSPTLQLISVTLTFYLRLTPALAISVSSVTVEIGITGIPLIPNRLYLNPLAVVVTVPVAKSRAPVAVTLLGDLALCHYDEPDPNKPDAVLEVQLGLTDFSLSAELQVPEGTTGLAINTLVSDLMGAPTDTGLPPALTLNVLTLYAQVNRQTGTIGSFSTEIAMSGGFGLLADFEIESFDLLLDYNA
jgi:hypothetical protein